MAGRARRLRDGSALAGRPRGAALRDDGARRLWVLRPGATLALTTLVRLRGRGITAVGSAVLQFGTYDLSGLTPAGRLIADEWFIEAYAGTAAGPHGPGPLADLRRPTGLPPVLVVVGADDVLLADNLALVARLSAAGVGRRPARLPRRTARVHRPPDADGPGRARRHRDLAERPPGTGGALTGQPGPRDG